MSSKVHFNVDAESNLQKNSDNGNVKTKPNLSSHSPSQLSGQKIKLLLCLVGVMAVVLVCLVVVVIVTAVLVSRGTDQQSQQVNGDPTIGMAKREALLRQVVELKSNAKRDVTSGGRQTTEESCYSIRTNKSHAAAQISGRGFRWTAQEPGTLSPSPSYGYQTAWTCANKSNAFVDGGMYFNQKDQKLYVPTCGYYYVTSQVFFQSDYGTPVNDDIRHQLNIQRNCSVTGYSVNDRVTLRSYSAFSATSDNVARSTNHIGDVVKLCEGGTIEVYIPNDQPCCPIGRYQTTYLSAFLISETSCESQVPLDHPPTVEEMAAAGGL